MYLSVVVPTLRATSWVLSFPALVASVFRSASYRRARVDSDDWLARTRPDGHSAVGILNKVGAAKHRIEPSRRNHDSLFTWWMELNAYGQKAGWSWSYVDLTLMLLTRLFNYLTLEPPRMV